MVPTRPLRGPVPCDTARLPDAASRQTEHPNRRADRRCTRLTARHNPGQNLNFLKPIAFLASWMFYYYSIMLPATAPKRRLLCRITVVKFVDLVRQSTSGGRVAAQVLLSAYNGSDYQLDVAGMGSLDQPRLRRPRETFAPFRR
jgi:hypothetical protein